jgi:hypothetical protein
LALIIGAVTDRDLVVIPEVEIEPIGQDLVVISRRLVQEIVERNDPNSAEQIVEQIVLSLAVIINL